MNYIYIISGTLKNGDLLKNKKYYIHADSQHVALKKIEDCLNFDDRIRKWNIEKIEITNEIANSNEGVWYEPF